jgi:hypothetical protein
MKTNPIELAFRLFVFIFLVIPFLALGVTILWWSFGIYFVYFAIAMFFLVFLCLLSQVPAGQVLVSVGTLFKALLLTPVAMLGSFFVAKAPKGTVGAGGIIADTINEVTKK